MAVAVVAIHTNPLADCRNESLLKVYELLVNTAVPFFFIASGYVLAIKMKWPDALDEDADIARILKQLRKIVQMYLLWTVIYLPLAVWHFVSAETSPIKAVVIYIRGFLLVGEQYNSWPLWYLLSTIYALLVIYFIFVTKKATIRNMIWLSIGSSIISVGLTQLANYEGNLPSLLHVFQKIIMLSIYNGRIFRGLIYIPIGMLLANKKIPPLLDGLIFIVGVIVSMWTVSTVVKNYLLILIAIALFEIIKSIRLNSSPIYLRLRNLSTTVYFVHMYIWSFYYKAVYGTKTYGLDSFLVTLIVSIGCYVVSDCIRTHTSRKFGAR